MFAAGGRVLLGFFFMGPNYDEFEERVCKVGVLRYGSHFFYGFQFIYGLYCEYLDIFLLFLMW